MDATGIVIWLAGGLAVGTGLMWWFTTSFPQHLFTLLRKLGYMKEAPDFWIQTDAELEYSERVGKLTRLDWEKWLQGKFHHAHPTLSHLFQCPGCMSGQLSLWLSITVALAMWQWWWVPLGAATWPCMGRIFARCAANV